MKQRIINGNSLEFFNDDNSKKGEIKISGSDVIINPIDSSGTVIFGEEGTINDIEVGASGTPVDFTFLGGGTITSNGGTLTLGESGDTIDLSNATIGTITASIFKGGQFIADSFELANITSSGTISGSVIEGQTIIADLNITSSGDMLVEGKITAREFHTEFVSASIVFQSGSTKFGDTLDDNHEITGSLNITGSTTLNRLFAKDVYAIELDPRSAGPKIHLGTTTDTDNFMTIGAFSAINNIDTNVRDFHLFGTNTTTGFYFDESAGKFGIGTTTPPEKLTVIGNISASGTGSFGRMLIGPKPIDSSDEYMFSLSNGASTDSNKRFLNLYRSSTYSFRLNQYLGLTWKVNGNVTHNIFNTSTGSPNPLLKLGLGKSGVAHITTYNNDNSLNLSGSHGVNILTNLTASGNISSSGGI